MGIVISLKDYLNSYINDFNRKMFIDPDTLIPMR